MYHFLLQRLAALYGQHEGRALLRMVCEEVLALEWVDVLTGALDTLSPLQNEQIETVVQRLEQHEPIQYILGKATFAGRAFAVDSRVLIPRPETEDLVNTVLAHTPTGPCRALDIGTGTGCIALTVAAERRQWQVVAWDNSPGALAVAQQNAATFRERDGVDNVCFAEQDILTHMPTAEEQWEIIVANPPYVCEEEKTTMERNVVAYEPAAALFIPDRAPLLFFEAIARYAAATLTAHGHLFVEVNSRFADDVRALLINNNFTCPSPVADRYGRARIVFGERL